MVVYIAKRSRDRKPDKHLVSVGKVQKWSLSQTQGLSETMLVIILKESSSN